MKLNKIIFIFIIFSVTCDGFAQYPVINTGRPRIYADQERLDWCKANYSITGAFKKDYDEFVSAYNRDWITTPDLYLAGTNTANWTWNWDSQWAQSEAYFTVFIYKVSGSSQALERCKFLAQQVITAVNNANFKTMEWYEKEDFLRKISESGGLILDWCYDDLPPALRDNLVQAMYKQNTEFMNTFILSYEGTNYVASHNSLNTIICNQNALVLFNASGLSATQQNTVESWYRAIYDKLVSGFMPCWSYYRDDDGGWNWGASYSMGSLIDQFQFFENMRIATNTNLFTTLPWVQNSINQYIYFLQPDNKTIHLGDGVMKPAGDIVMFLHARYFNDPRSIWLAQYWTLPENGVWTALLCDKMLYKDYNTPIITQPDNPLNWWADKVGLSVSRSSWDKDATMVTFFNSPSKKAAHEHRDNNNFTIYKHAPLLIDAGHYDLFGSNHFINYYHRTIAHNTICVYDNTETYHYYGQPISNDGGQIESMPLVNYDDIFAPANQRGKWIQYATGDDYTYNIADAQLSYDPNKLDFFRRRLLYVKPQKVIVLDHVHLKNVTIKQRDIKWIAHFANRPNISGSVTRTEAANHIMTYNGTDYTAANGNGNIAIRTLIPENSNTTLIGGAGYEYWVDGKNYPPDPVPDMSFYTPGSWRIEVRPDNVPDDGNVVYLHTIDVGDNSNPSKAGGIAFQNTVSVGTDWENVLYFFAADGGVDKDYHIFEGVDGERTVSIYAADMLPDLYSIKIDGAIVEAKNTDSNGVLQTSVYLPPGSHTVEISKDCTTIPPQATGPTNIIPDNSSTTYTAVPEMDDYVWEIQPPESYTEMQKSNNQLLVTWNTNYVGKVDISYKTQNDCGWSLAFSPDLTVSLLPTAPSVTDGLPCGGASTEVTALNYENVTGYSWHIDPVDAGTIISQANKATITWLPSFSGPVDVSYSVTDAEGLMYTSESVPVIIQRLPDKPSVANGPTSVDWNVSESTLTADPDGDSYEWQINPASAGTMIPDGNMATIYWDEGSDHSYVGQVQVSYRITKIDNDCEFSEFSPALIIDLLPKPPTSLENPCAGTNTGFETRLYTNASTYQWNIDPADAGTISNQGNTATITWLPSFSGQVNVSYAVIDAAENSFVSESVPVNIQGLPTKPNVADGPGSVDWNVAESTVVADPGGDSYEWQIIPAVAGTITSDGNSATIHWAGGDEHSYAGQVQVSYRITEHDNDCGFSEFSPALIIDLLPKSPTPLENNPCAGTNTVFETQLYANAASYQWNINPEDAGTINNQGNTAIITWLSSFSGEASVSYSVVDASGLTISSESIPVNIRALPAKPGMAQGPDMVNWNVTESTLTADSGGDSYEWKITPAGTITANGNSATISWAGGDEHSYAGPVQVSYRITKNDNNCGFSEYSPALIIDLLPKPPIPLENNPCAGTNTVFETQLYANVSSYQWSINPAEAGTITSQANTATITWSQTFSGQVSVSYSVSDAEDRICTSLPVQVTVQPLPDVTEKATGPSTVGWSELSSNFAVSASATTDEQGYQWSLTPAAGTLSPSNNTRTATVTWDHQYVGTIHITYQEHNDCGWSASSPVLPVVLQPEPPKISNKVPCSNSSSTASAPIYINANDYSWKLIPADAGVISDDGSPNQVNITWDPLFDGGLVTVEYTVIVGEERYSSSTQVTVKSLPYMPKIATGPSSVNWNEPFSNFAVDASAITDAQGYQWSLTPVAGTVSSPNNTSPVTVTWDHQYAGTILVTYMAHNECGWSASSPVLPVVLQPAPPEVSDKEPCSGTSSTASAPNYKNAKGYSWSLAPANAGTITVQANVVTITWSPTFSGQANVSYSVSDIEGRICTSSPVQVMVQPLPAAPGMATGPSSVGWNESASNFAVAVPATTDAQGYQWSLNPVAGTFSSGNTSPVTVTWDHQYVGTVQVAYKAHNGCGWSVSSPARPVVLQATPPEIFDKEPCSGSSSTVSAPIYKNVKGYYWDLVPASAGTITIRANTATINWSSSFSGQANVSYSVIDAAGGVNTSSKVQITVKPLPDVPEIAAGPSSVSWDGPASIFAVAALATTDAQGYQWSITPASAGTFSSPGDKSPVTVLWDHQYIGTAHVAYKAHNGCGWSASSPALPVVLQPAPPKISNQEPCSLSSTASAPVYQNASGYSWNLVPANAGTISDGSGNQVQIRWDPLFPGGLVTVEYTVSVGAERYSSSTQVNVQPLSVSLPQASGNATVTHSESTTVYSASSEWREYRWEISPAEASTSIQVDGNQLSVSWNKKYVGKVNISYQIRNECGWSPNSSPALVVTLLPGTPSVDLMEVCNNSETVVSAPSYQNVPTYQWHISPSGAGQIVDAGHQAVIQWSNLYTGEAEISYTVVNLAQESYTSSPVILPVKELAKPSIASGANKVYLNHPLETYQATSAGIQYEWKVIPSQAAVVQNPASETTSILWGPTYYGEAKVTYRIWNECGWSEMSDPLVVQVYQSDLSEDIPGIFTPNGDGFNDIWDIPGIHQYPEAMIRIYNRAKRLVVEFKGAQLPWDGRDRNGSILESGYYLYQIELKKDGKVVSGYVTILR